MLCAFTSDQASWLTDKISRRRPFQERFPADEAATKVGRLEADTAASVAANDTPVARADRAAAVAVKLGGPNR